MLRDEQIAEDCIGKGIHQGREEQQWEMNAGFISLFNDSGGGQVLISPSVTQLLDHLVDLFLFASRPDVLFEILFRLFVICQL